MTKCRSRKNNHQLKSDFLVDPSTRFISDTSRLQGRQSKAPILTCSSSAQLTMHNSGKNNHYCQPDFGSICSKLLPLKIIECKSPLWNQINRKPVTHTIQYNKFRNNTQQVRLCSSLDPTSSTDCRNGNSVRNLLSFATFWSFLGPQLIFLVR